MTEEATLPLALDDLRGDVMKAPDEVSAMLRLKGGLRPLTADIMLDNSNYRAQYEAARYASGAPR
jgi:hypothetical protein